jgi:hypothetical protein
MSKKEIIIEWKEDHDLIDLIDEVYKECNILEKIQIRFWNLYWKIKKR